MPDPIATQVADHYDRSVDAPLATALREGSRFHNYGYWHDGAVSMQEASERLMAELVARSEVPPGAAILDVACGMGATTRYIAEHAPAGRVVGINISDRQLASCREFAPGLEFLNMSAVDMTFEDATFDAVFCVEAAFHFNTRRRFLQEARRVLRPGGRLALTDIPNPGTGTDGIPENAVASAEAYAELLRDCGLRLLSLIDRSRECVGGYVPFVLFFRDTLMRRGELSPLQHRWLTRRLQAVSRISYIEVIAEAA